MAYGILVTWDAATGNGIIAPDIRVDNEHELDCRASDMVEYSPRQGDAVAYVRTCDATKQKHRAAEVTSAVAGVGAIQRRAAFGREIKRLRAGGGSWPASTKGQGPPPPPPPPPPPQEYGWVPYYYYRPHPTTRNDQQGADARPPSEKTLDGDGKQRTQEVDPQGDDSSPAAPPAPAEPRQDGYETTAAAADVSGAVCPAVITHQWFIDIMPCPHLFLPPVVAGVPCEPEAPYTETEERTSDV